MRSFLWKVYKNQFFERKHLSSNCFFWYVKWRFEDLAEKFSPKFGIVFNPRRKTNIERCFLRNFFPQIVRTDTKNAVAKMFWTSVPRVQRMFCQRLRAISKTSFRSGEVRLEIFPWTLGILLWDQCPIFLTKSEKDSLEFWKKLQDNLHKKNSFSTSCSAVQTECTFDSAVKLSQLKVHKQFARSPKLIDNLFLIECFFDNLFW